jgi:hypothetical protein
LIESFFCGWIVGTLLDGNYTDLKWEGFTLSEEVATE